jgi:Homeodomain-like domain
MDAHRSPTRRIVLSGYDGRTGIDLARSTYSPRTAAADYSKINGAFSDSPKPSAPSPSAKRRARAASHPAPRPNAGRPSMLQNLIDLIGHDGATALIAAFGGTRVYIPQAPEPADTLSEVIGHLPACALAQIFGGDRLEVPNPPPRRMRILELRAKGLTINAIARTLGCTRRRVFQVIAEARAAAESNR